MSSPTPPPILGSFRSLAAVAAAWLVAAPLAAGAANFARPLVVSDDRATDGTVAVETGEFALVFSRHFNGGIRDLFDLGFDPGRSDNLATASAGGFYSNGALFDWDFYLGTDGGNVGEFMTTMGHNADPGDLVFDVLENSPARVRILQSGHPRLNNGQGPPGDPFPELDQYTFTSVWTLYPSGKVAIDFTGASDPSAEVVDAGPGGGGKSLNAQGCCGNETIVTASGADFVTAEVWPGDRVSSAAGGWGPNRVVERLDATTLRLEDAVPAGSGLNYEIRRDRIFGQTLSIHNDGDPDLVNQCFDPAVSRWQGGSNGDALWDDVSGDGCGTLYRNGGAPPARDDYVLAHWARDRAFGTALALYEKWLGATAGFYNDVGFTDVSYTQLGRFIYEPAPTIDRHLMAQIGSSASAALPTIDSALAATLIADDYVAPYAEALAGTLATHAGISAFGFNPATAAYEISADCNEAAIRFDGSGGARANATYYSPVVVVDDFSVPDDDVVVERSQDGGATFDVLPASIYNLTGTADEAEVGANRRILQWLNNVPGWATGSSSWAIRLRSTSAPACLQAPAKKAKLDRLNAPVGDDRMTFKSDSFSTLSLGDDPQSDGVVVRLRRDGEEVWSADVAPGTEGWKASKRRFVLRAKGRADGLARLSIDRPAAKARIKLKVQGADLAGAASASALELLFEIGGDRVTFALSCTHQSGKVRC